MCVIRSNAIKAREPQTLTPRLTPHCGGALFNMCLGGRRSKIIYRRFELPLRSVMVCEAVKEQSPTHAEWKLYILHVT